MCSEIGGVRVLQDLAAVTVSSSARERSTFQPLGALQEQRLIFCQYSKQESR